MKCHPLAGMLVATWLLAGCAAQTPVKPAPGPGTSTTARHGDDITLALGDPAQDQTSQQQRARITHALQMIQHGQPRQAIDGPLTAVTDYYERAYADSGKVVFSARDLVRTLAYLATVANHADQTGQPGKGAIVIGPAWAMAYWAKGYAYNAMAQYVNARGELDKALALAPMNSQYTSELAYTYLKTAGWHRALDLYRNAAAYAELAASHDTTHLKCVALRGQGYVLVELHRLDDAVKAYQSCLKLNPDDPKSHGELRYIKRLRSKTHAPAANAAPAF